MKKVLFALVLTIASTGFARARVCPTGTIQNLDCKSTPAPGDNEIAAGLLDSILVCAKEERIFLVVQKDSSVESSEAEVEMRPGGNSYTLYTEDVDFSLSHATGLGPSASKELKATFAISLKNADNTSLTSTYTCQ